MTQEKEILNRVNDIAIAVNNLHKDHENLGEKVDDIKENVKEINARFTGPDSLEIQVDRLKQSEASRKWINRLILGAVGTIIVYEIFGVAL